MCRQFRVGVLYSTEGSHLLQCDVTVGVDALPLMAAILSIVTTEISAIIACCI